MHDVDDTIREVHGYAKQAAAYATPGCGLNTRSPPSPPRWPRVIARARLRKGSTASARARAVVGQATPTARNAGVKGQILCRADGLLRMGLRGAAIRKKTWFS